MNREDCKMKSFSTKLLLAVAGVALLAGPALAQRPHHQAAQQLQDSWTGSTAESVGIYPNGASRSGSAYSRDSGAEDNVIR